MPVYSRIGIEISSYEANSSWIDTDHVYQRQKIAIMEVSSTVLKKLDERGVAYQVLVKDLSSYYKNQNRQLKDRSREGSCSGPQEGSPRNFKLGSMGGYLTLEELKAELDKMHELYPTLVKKAQPISNFVTSEGRPVLWTSITGKYEYGQTKKNVLYTALHHAREPMSMQQMVYFMWYVLENYNKEPMVRRLLDKTRLYFIPCVNPDGYHYNATVSPDGGGMWRKNRRPLSNGHFGVDLNRNYGYEWGYNTSGSSTDPESELYRGPSAFSEPETQAVKWFCENNEIQVALNYHSYGDYLIYPWGYKSGVTKDDKRFQSLAQSLTLEKRILYGTSRETVLYTTNGDADDWMYGETESKNRIYSMTPEVGPSEYGFWPPKDKIELLSARELNQNIRMAFAPHGFVMMVPAGDPIIYSKNFKHRFYLYPVTMEDGVVQSKIKPLTDNILNYQESFYVYGLDNNEEYELDIELKPGMEDGELVQFEMTLDNGNLISTDTVSYIFSSHKEVIDVLGRSADIDKWIRSNQSSNSWGSTTTDYYSAPASITDSPKGLYATATENAIISSESYRIPREEEVFLTFKAKWDITFGQDFAQLSISTDGVDFTPLCGQLTTENFNYKGDISPVYTGIQKEWLTENISLNDYKGEDVYFKWNMVSQSADAKDGIFIDDMKIAFSQTITSSQDQIIKWDSHQLYPNPVSGPIINLNISRKNISAFVKSYEIRNHLGQLTGMGKVHAGVNPVPIMNYSPGIYFIGLITTEGRRVQSRKFIVLP